MFASTHRLEVVSIRDLKIELFDYPNQIMRTLIAGKNLNAIKQLVETLDNFIELNEGHTKGIAIELANDAAFVGNLIKSENDLEYLENHTSSQNDLALLAMKNTIELSCCLSIRFNRP